MVWTTLAGLCVMAACRVPGDHTQNVVIIASDAQFPPFHFVDEQGAVSGHDIELARMVLERAGYGHDTRVVRPYGDLLAGLESGSHQLVAATTGRTAERERRFRFSDPYFRTCQAVVVRAGPSRPRRLADLHGRRVGAAGSGTSAKALQQLPGVTAVYLTKGSEGMSALRRGDIDGYIVDEFEAVSAVRAEPQVLDVLQEPAALEEYGFVVPRHRGDLQRRVNRALRALQHEGATEQLRRQFGIERDADWPVDLAAASAARRQAP